MRGRTRRHGWTIVALAVFLCIAWSPGLFAQVGLEIDVTGNAAPTSLLTANVIIDVQDGSTVQTIAWTQREGANVTFTNPGGATTGVRLATRPQYRAHLVEIMREPPVSVDQLPPNVQVPDGEFLGGIPHRFQVVGPNPFALEEAAIVEIMVAVTTTSGTYRRVEEIHVNLPWLPATSLRNVPVMQPVLFAGKEQDNYRWRMMSRPAGSNARLVGGGTMTPEFFPDVPGEFVVRVFDQDAGMQQIFTIYAGTWDGMIIGQDANGRPVNDDVCNSCHFDGFAGDQFTPWAESGHAEIFTDQLVGGNHYGPNCLSCHTVGYTPGRSNNGFDDQASYMDLVNAGLFNAMNPNAWDIVLEDFPALARRANIQCENCHGPHKADPGGFDGGQHGADPDVDGEPRVSIASDVCATCHGEPLRHARFQQWQFSRHANYELAVEEGTSGSCARCHSGNGFLEWLPVLLGDAPGDPLDDITVSWEADDVHPITCAVCHDPHSVGTTTGVGTDATTRISGDTPPLIAGFQALSVGNGAICMTCHNSRRGLFNDATFEDSLLQSPTREAHGGAQGDVLMGENAFLVNVGVRGRHSLVTDTCATCHMTETPPPDVLSYNQGGTNHTFYAGETVCANCHQGIESLEPLKNVVMTVSHDIEELAEEALLQLMRGIVAGGNTLDVDGNMVTSPGQIVSVDWGNGPDGEALTSRGRQAVNVRLTGGVLVEGTRIDAITVMQPPPMGEAVVSDFASEELLKAMWNWFLIHQDESYGAHNPTWTLQVLDAARDALGGVGGPRSLIPYTPAQLALKDGVPVRAD